MNYKKTNEGVVVFNEFWEVLHSKKSGGAWSSIVFKNGSGKNLLAGPVSSTFRFHENGLKGGNLLVYRESNDKSAVITVGKNAKGGITVITEGKYKDEKGKTLPANFKRTMEYNKWGLVKNKLEIIAKEDFDGVVEVCPLNMVFRKGMNKANIRPHPSRHLGMMGCPDQYRAGWKDLPGKHSFMDRYIPAYISVFEQDVEGLELFPGSELLNWDKFTGFEGEGYFEVASLGGGETNISLNAYCVVHRRVPIKVVKGSHIFELNFGLPFVRERKKIFNSIFHAGINSDWTSDAELKRLAEGGVTVLRFHCDYREDAPFWHDMMYPPFDKKGMKELRRVINTAHKLKMKVIPYISCKEFHPETEGYLENHKQWMRKELLSGAVSHTYVRSGEFGALMCMKSGWLEARKKNVDIILKDLPWDGLYFDWAVAHPCCHEEHAASTWHTDTDEFADFMIWCRERVGKNGFIFTHLSGYPSLISENLSNLIFVGEVDLAYMPDEWHPECTFIPVTQKILAVGGTLGTPATNRLLLSSMVQGHPYTINSPVKTKFLNMYDEIGLFKGEKLSDYSFARASERPVATGEKDVYASLYWKKDKAMVYLGNISEKSAAGSFRLDLEARGLKGKKVVLEEVKSKTKLASTVEDIKYSGISYNLAPWSSAFYKIKVVK